jgi:hypothetical protein
VNSNFGFRNAKTKERYMIHDSRYMIPERSMEFRKVDISRLLDAVGCASFCSKNNTCCCSMTVMTRKCIRTSVDQGAGYQTIRVSGTKFRISDCEMRIADCEKKDRYMIHDT